MATAEQIYRRDRPADQMAARLADGWPAFITADQQVKRHIGRIREHFSDLELVLLDELDVVVAAGWAVPIRWNGDAAHLPEGYTDSLVWALAQHDGDQRSDTLVVMAAQVHPGHRGRGLAAQLLCGFRGVANQRHWARVIAPVRPPLKSRYPLTPIDRFAAWTRADGAPLDPWLRTHWRMGARVIATAPRLQTMTGTVAEWQILDRHGFSRLR